MSQPVVGHGQEEEVEGVGLAAARGQAPLQGRDRLGVLARAILDDAQRVEVDRFCREPARRRAGPAPARGPVARVDSGPLASSQARLLQHVASHSRTTGWSGLRASAASRSAIAGS